MPALFWPLINALQAGALLALTFSFGAEAWSRRDRMMVFLSLCCSAVALRHGLLTGAGIGLLNPASAIKAQSVLATLGFLALLEAMAAILPRHVPRPFALWAFLAFAPNFIRNLFLEADHPLNRPLHHATNLVYIGTAIYLIARALKARQDRELMASHLLYGMAGAAVPVVAEAAVNSLFDQQVPFSGFSLLFLATVLGASRHGVMANDMEARLRSAQSHAEGWRRLIPGPTWDSREQSLLMDRTFGGRWREGLSEVQRGKDGQLYEIIETEVADGKLGWLRVASEDQPAPGFLSGWTVALGMDEGSSAEEATLWLETWGAQVEPWGTLPPREGPYPSVLIWAREPSILAVWREGDRLRRRPRWVQVGGPVTDGPHLRVDAPLRREELEQGLRRLLSV